MSDDTTIHAVGYAHLDPVWFWRWTEGYQEARATFRSALDRMKEFPDFVFTSSQAAVYEWVEENDPAMIEEIAARVREGRWCVVGGWWIEADCNIPGGESFARQGLYAQRWFRKRFGVIAETGFSADAFGHNAMIPQLVAKAGMRSYLFMRPNRVENPDCPSPAFRWRSPDGTTIVAYRLTHSYCTQGEEISEEAVEDIASWASESVRDLMMFYGVGNHGGGPTIRNLQSMEKIRALGGPQRLVLSSPDACFRKLHAASSGLPLHDGEWQHHASGCYAAYLDVKRMNRRAENTLTSAEKLSVLASRLAGWTYRKQELARAWREVLFCQAHDIMAGTCTREAYDDVRHMFGEALRIAARETNGAAQRIAAHIDTTGQGTPVVVFNPHSFPVRAVVECDMTRESRGEGDYSLTDPAGNGAPCQMTTPGAVAENLHRLCFLADLPALGYATYRIHNAGESTGSGGESTGSGGESTGSGRVSDEEGDGILYRTAAASMHAGYVIHPDGRDNLQAENRWFRVEIDGRRGDIVRLLDKRTGVDVFSGSAAVPIVLDDPSDTWSHGVFSYDVQRGRFADARVRVVEQGPVRIVIRAKSRFRNSTLVQDFIVYRDLPRLTVRAVVDWHETLAVLKLCFPVNVTSAVATHEIPYGHIERRPNGEEEPGQNWLDVTGEAVAEGRSLRYGLSILNDCLYSSDVRGSVIRISVLRSPVYAHHTPARLVPDGDYAYMDQGEHAFSYELLPHAGTWQEAETVRHAQVLNAPPVALVEHVHAGSLGPAAEHVRIDARHVVLTAMKLSEDTDDIVLRCSETEGRAASGVKLELPFIARTMTFAVHPCEVKTLVVPIDPSQPVRETTFLED